MKRAMITAEPLEFVISDFSITSMQRSIVGGTNEITAAQCSLTLQEIPIEATFKSKFARPKIAPPLVTPDEEQTDLELDAVSLTTTDTSQTHTGFQSSHQFGMPLNADSTFAVGSGPTS